VAVQVALCPFIAVLKTTDSFATSANTTDYTDAAQDSSTSTTLVLSSLATSGAVWVGSHVPFRGLSIDVNAANTNAATMVATYYNTAGTMASLSVTDGTAITGGTLQQDGLVTWTMPTDWQSEKLSTVASAGDGIPYRGNLLYWAKITAGAALDSSTTQNSWIGLNRSTAYHEISAAAPELSMKVMRGIGGISGVEVKCDAVTANVIVNCLTSGRFL
jgi:hypothetical protein